MREHVSLWHPWQEKSGVPHPLALFSSFRAMPVQGIVDAVGATGAYALCSDILSGYEVDPALLLHEKTECYLSRSQSAVALRIKGKGRSGFLIPGAIWCEPGQPGRQLLANMGMIFARFGMQAITPSSLSEKVLRRTLPDRLCISRPCVPLRRCILAHRAAGCILQQRRAIRVPEGHEYDKNKAYLSIAAEGVPSPFLSPLSFCGMGWWREYPVSYCHVQMVAHPRPGIQPYYVRDASGAHSPKEGEWIDTWMWSGQVEDCERAGYSVNVQEGWAWPQKSTFLSTWARIIGEACEEDRSMPWYSILKRMSTGLPGRFLKRPETYSLIHISEWQPGDCPLRIRAEEDQWPVGDWFMRVDETSEQAREQAQLTPVGDYIVAECERQIYRDCLKEEQAGNRILRIYIDSIVLAEPARFLPIGRKPGQYKYTPYWRVRIHLNRFRGVSSRGLVSRAPGISYKRRQRLLGGAERAP